MHIKYLLHDPLTECSSLVQISSHRSSSYKPLHLPSKNLLGFAHCLNIATVSSTLNKSNWYKCFLFTNKEKFISKVKVLQNKEKCKKKKKTII